MLLRKRFFLEYKKIVMSNFTKNVQVFFLLTLMLMMFSCSENQDLSVTFKSNEDHKLYTLPDGSKVWLNKGSELAHGKKLNTQEGERLVKVKGEAYFDISRDPSNPFVVSTGSTQTKTDGAKMSVKTTDGSVGVEVQEGSATFSSGSQKVNMKEGTNVEFDSKAGKVSKSEGNSLNAFAWLTKRMVFRDQYLKEIFKELGKYFKLQFEVSNPAILDCRFTGEFDEPKLEDVLNVLSTATNITYSKSSTKVEIEGDGCTN